MISKEKDMNKEGDGKKVRDQRTGRMNGIEKCIGFENWDSRNWDSRTGFSTKLAIRHDLSVSGYHS
jgi:hypothetical protein